MKACEFHFLSIVSSSKYAKYGAEFSKTVMLVLYEDVKYPSERYILKLYSPGLTV